LEKYTFKEIKEFVSKPLFNEKVILNKDPTYPKISIVTPSYNQAEFLERTILSVLNQNYLNLEYIIIDGGSNDGSVEIIKKYEKYLTYWVSEKDKGQGCAISKGFEKSTSDILAWLNSDDTYLPGTFYKIAKDFRQNSEVDLIFGNIYFIDDTDKRIRELRFTEFDFSTLIYEGGNLHQTGTFWTRKIYEKVGGLNSNYKFCMDYDFFCRAAKVGKLCHTRDFLANFRIHANAKSSTISHIGHKEHKEITKRYIPKDLNKWNLEYKKIVCIIRRFYKYIMQGDIDYILKGFVRRITNYGRKK